MTWWEWAALWFALVLGAGWVLFLRVRSIWRKALALFAELGVAAERFSVLSEELDTLGRRAAAAPDLAVFDSPSRLRQERAAGPARRARHRAPAR